MIDSRGDIPATELSRQTGIGYGAARRIKTLLARPIQVRAQAFEHMSAQERFVLAIQLCSSAANPVLPALWRHDRVEPGGHGADPSGARSFHGRSGHLPVFLDRFVGRRREIATVLRLIQQARLVTLTGDGGCGKTRLAVEVAARDAAKYADGVWWVDLARVDRNRSVSIAVADALGLYDQPRRSQVGALVEQLRRRCMLVVFDNCEHLLDGCVEVILPVLRACPAVRVLATSREALSVDGEVVWRVPALSTPDQATKLPTAALLKFDAAALFVDRAKAAKPLFALSQANVDAVARVCRQLDGIPLAIELAAARVSAFTPQQIATAQQDSFAWATGPRRSAPPRHQTLRASMDWSYGLLEEDERTVFRRLSVFPASFSPEAACEVCGDARLAADQVLPLLSRLIGKSLVVAEEHALSYRYRLLQTVRQYAIRRLTESGELDETRARHLRHALALVERADPGSPREYQPGWFDSLDSERASLRTALDWAIAHTGTDAALRLANGLALFYITRGHSSEGQRWFADTLAAVEPSSPPSAAHARALWAAGFVDLNALEAKSAQAKALAAVEMAQAVGDRQTAARARDLLGLILVNTNPAQARIHLEEAATLASDLGDDWCLGHARQLIAWSWTMQGALNPARRERAGSLEVVKPLGTPFFLAWHWLGVALLARQAGDFAEGTAASAQAQADAAQARDPLCHAWAAMCQAEFECLRGQAAAAQQAIADLDARLQLSAASPTASALMHVAVGKCALALARLADAEPELSAAIEIGREGWSLLILGDCLVDLADISLLRGEAARARQLADDVVDCGTSLGNRRMAAAASVIRARCALSEGDLDAAWSLSHEALAIQADQGYKADALVTLNVIAGICAQRGTYERAARLYGAIDAAGRRLGISGCPVDSLRWPDRDRVVRALDDQALRGLLAEGSTLSLEEATDYASRGRGVRNRPQAGWASLTSTELAVVRLLTAGLTNSDIAEKMLITPGTVKAHMSHIFTKVGVSHRAELAAVAARRLTSASDQ